MNDGASVLWRAAYDGDGVRRKRVDAKGTIHYLGGYERNVGNGQDTTETITKYYRALGRLIAFRRNGSLYWVGTDHLGGTVAVANSSFGPIATMRYTPYGVSRDNTDDPLTDSLFTSQKLDASIGLYWYGSRAYDQSLGRFVSPDSIVPSPGNPQALNRYSYTYNNPMRYVDPSGHDPYQGMGIVVYDNPSYLPVEQRQALYEHNSTPSVSNGSQGTVRVHESGGGGGGGDPWAGQGVVVLQNPSYLPVEQREALYAHNTAASAGGGEAASPPTINQVAGSAGASYVEALSYPSRQSIGPTPVAYYRPVYAEYAVYTPGADEMMPAHDPGHIGPPTPSMSEAEHNLQEFYKGVVDVIANEGVPMAIKAATGVNVDAPWAAGSQLVEDHTKKPGMDPMETAWRIHRAITLTLLTPEIATIAGGGKALEVGLQLFTDVAVKPAVNP